MSDRKRSIFGVVFLTIFLDMVGFSIIFPLFPAMLDHYLFLEQSMGGGIISLFVSWVSEFGHDLLPGNPNFRLETVIFRGDSWFTICNPAVFLCPDLGRFI
jgi:hypothetical protein